MTIIYSKYRQANDKKNQCTRTQLKLVKISVNVYLRIDKVVAEYFK